VSEPIAELQEVIEEVDDLKGDPSEDEHHEQLDSDSWTVKPASKQPPSESQRCYERKRQDNVPAYQRLVANAVIVSKHTGCFLSLPFPNSL